MSHTLAEFHPFPRLPIELRKEIWRYCLPRRVHELDQPVDEYVFFTNENRVGPWPCSLHDTTYMNSRPPVISRVCYESRAVAFETGRLLPNSRTHRPPEAYWSSDFDLRYGAWHDRTRDMFHLNWTYAHEIAFGFAGSPLHCIAWEAANHSTSASITFDILGQRSHARYGVGPTPKNLPPGLSDTEILGLRDVEALQQLPSWLIVMEVVVIHCSIKKAAGTGLFGLLGDARVQIVDAFEKDRVEAYFELAQECEPQESPDVESADPIHPRQCFHGETAESMVLELREDVRLRFDPQFADLADALRPAIMFRLCTHMCNHGRELPQ